MLMIQPHIVFNIPFDLMYNKCYPLHAKTTLFLFFLWLLLTQQFLTNQDFGPMVGQNWSAKIENLSKLFDFCFI